MPKIRPSSDLRNHYNEISEFCHKTQEPVFITKNGTGDVVIISNEVYERLCGREYLFNQIDSSLNRMSKTSGRSAKEVLADIAKEFNLE